MPARIGNKNLLNRRLRVIPIKIKRILVEIKKVSVKKKGQTVREMNVRRKSTSVIWKSKIANLISL